MGLVCGDFVWSVLIQSEMYNILYFFCIEWSFRYQTNYKKHKNSPFGDGYSLVRSEIPNKTIVISLAGWAWASKSWASMGSGWTGLRVHGLGLGWAVGCPARGEHCSPALCVRPDTPASHGLLKIKQNVIFEPAASYSAALQERTKLIGSAKACKYWISAGK